MSPRSCTNGHAHAPGRILRQRQVTPPWQRRTRRFISAMLHRARPPDEVVSDYHQPYMKALEHIWPDVRHRRSGLYRARGVTTKPIERSHIPTRDRLRNSRGLKTIASAQRFLEGFEALYAVRPATFGHACRRL